MMRDLLLGLSLAFRGARTRTALTAVGIGLAMSVLLFATAIPDALQKHQDRTAARTHVGTPANGNTGHAKVPERGLLGRDIPTVWRGADVTGVELQALSTDVPVPPGIPRVPPAGEVYVSPALAAAIAEPDGRLLAERLPGRVVGTIDRRTLSGPNDLLWYGGSDDVATAYTDTSNYILQISRFGSSPGNPQLGTMLDLLVLIGAIVLLFPIAILVATAARFGSARRDRRLAALRLMGASQARTARIAAGESLAGALLGVVLGGVLLTFARGLVEHVHLLGFSMFTSDVTPNPALVLLVVVAVLLLTVAVTVLSLRRVSIEPLAVSRRAATRARRFWWRPLPVIAGFALLLPLAGTAALATDQHRVRIGLGAVLVLGGVVLLLPWLVDALVRRARGWSPSSQLAIRTLQPEAAAASRIVSGIAVAIAGAITLQMLITTATGRVEYATRVAESSADQVAQVHAPVSTLPAMRAAIEQTNGVTAVHVFSDQTIDPRTPVSGSFPSLVVASCADLGELTSVTRCRDGDVFRATTPSTRFRSQGQAYSESTPVPGPGQVVSILPPTGNIDRGRLWRTPAAMTTVQARIAQGQPQAGIYATPGAGTPTPRGAASLRAFVHLDPDDPLALERLRTTLAQFDTAATVSANDTVDDHRVAVIRRALLAGSALLLLLIGASLVVTTFEQLGERRRTLATLAAFGTPAKVLRRALWWQVAIPVVLGLVLAVALGVPLGAVLLRLQQQPFVLPLGDTLALLALGGGMVVLVLAAALPLLRRVAAPSALRTE